MQLIKVPIKKIYLIKRGKGGKKKNQYYYYYLFYIISRSTLFLLIYINDSFFYSVQNLIVLFLFFTSFFELQFIFIFENKVYVWGLVGGLFLLGTYAVQINTKKGIQTI